MSILRIISCRADTEHSVKEKIRYLADNSKNQWKGVDYSGINGSLRNWPELVSPFDLDAISASFILPHQAYGDIRPGRRLFYHILIDFNGLLSPQEAVRVGWEIAAWFRQFNVQYLCGLHCIKQRKPIAVSDDTGGFKGVFHPHIHLLVSTRTLDGTGLKLHMGKRELHIFKLYANNVLQANGLPLINMRNGGNVNGPF